MPSTSKRQMISPWGRAEKGRIGLIVGWRLKRGEGGEGGEGAAGGGALGRSRRGVRRVSRVSRVSLQEGVGLGGEEDKLEAKLDEQRREHVEDTFPFSLSLHPQAIRT